MAKYNINDFMKIKKGGVVLLNKSNCSEYKDMIKDIQCTPISEYNYIKGSFVDTLFVGIVKSIKKTTSEQGKLLGRLTFKDCSGELSILLFEKQIHEVYKLDLDLPIKIVLRLTNPPEYLSSSPGYRFISATKLFS